MSGGSIVDKQGLVSSFQRNNENTIPPGALLPVKRAAARAGRNAVYKPAETRMPITPQNPLIEWDVPNSNNVWIDWSRASIIFDLSLTRVGGTFIRASNLIWNCIDRFELEEGNEQVEDYQFYPEKKTLHYTLHKQENGSENHGESFYGDGSQANRNTKGAAPVWTYKIPIQSIPLSKTSALPMFPPFHSTANRLRFRWYIGQPSRWIETDAPTFTWTISRWEIHYDQVIVENKQAFAMGWTNSPLGLGGVPKFSWLCDDVAIRNLDISTTQVVLIDQKRQSIHGILCTIRRNSETNDPTINDKFETWYGPSGVATLPLTQYQWRFNDGYWPERPISLTDDYGLSSFWKLAHWLNHDNGEGNPRETNTIGADEYMTHKFVLVGDFRTWPALIGSYNSVSTAHSNQNIELHLQFSAPPEAGLQIVIHTFYDRDWYYGKEMGTKVTW
jgi:hypothetical protein